MAALLNASLQTSQLASCHSRSSGFSSHPVRGVARQPQRLTVVAAETKEKAPWKPPTLNPDTPSPIFGGSTGGLLRKAQVQLLYLVRVFADAAASSV